LLTAIGAFQADFVAWYLPRAIAPQCTALLTVIGAFQADFVAWYLPRVIAPQCTALLTAMGAFQADFVAWYFLILFGHDFRVKGQNNGCRHLSFTRNRRKRMKFRTFMLGGLAGAAVVLLMQQRNVKMAGMAGNLGQKIRQRMNGLKDDAIGKMLNMRPGSGRRSSESGGLDKVSELAAQDANVRREVDSVLEESGRHRN
jgi:hypothetical protein